MWTEKEKRELNRLQARQQSGPLTETDLKRLIDLNRKDPLNDLPWNWQELKHHGCGDGWKR